MKKNISKFYLMGLVTMIICQFAACDKGEGVVFDVFNNGSDERNLIVVISDLHLGADLSYAQTYENLAPLENFLDQIRESPNVKELIIAGDMLDEWFVPATIDTYNGYDQADFVQRVVATNIWVIDALNRIINDGIILVTYIPGNHDLTITAENVASILPGINQARDDESLGLGTYSPDNFPEIAIEHGHRYNILSAPDPISNQDIAPGTILPPGYFYLRIAALHIVQGCTENIDVIPTVTPNNSGNDSQDLLYGYWQIWASAMNIFTIENYFDEDIIVTNINGFTDTYSVNDLLPSQDTEGGLIEVNLFDGIQDTWDQRCALNNVAVAIPTGQAIEEAVTTTGTDAMAVNQYFMNPDSNKRIVVFGHSHLAKIETSVNHQGQKSIYANSGTWVDYNRHGTTMTFVIITPQSDDDASRTYVKVYNFENEIVTEMAIDSLRL
jgi:UDP-2,3-diacylglucosamine pyrophosphatase LpxH